MDGIGEKLIKSLLELELVENISDLYNLTYNELLSLERMGEKSAKNVLNELDKTRKLTLSKFLHALGIERIGPEVATVLSRHFISLEKLLKWTIDGKNTDITYIDGIGNKVTEIFREGIKIRFNLIKELSNIIQVLDEEESKKGIFHGKTFCITGTLSMSRKEISMMLKNAGGKVVSSVSSKLDYLIVGESAGSKLKRAKDLGVKIINDQVLLNLFDQKSDDNNPNKTLFDFD